MTLNPTLLTPTLLKPLLLLLNSLFVYLTLTDPNPNPSKAPKQRALRGPIYNLFHLRLRVYSWYKYLFAAVSLLEVYSILTASQSSTTPPPQPTLPLSFLLPTLLLHLSSLLRLYCYKTLGPFFVFQLSTFPAQKLITSGPYSVVRHPSYPAFVLIILSGFLCVFAEGGWVRGSGILDEGLVLSLDSLTPSLSGLGGLGESIKGALQGLGGTLVLLGSEGRLQGLVYVLGGQITIPPLILQTLLYTFTLAIAAATLGLCAGTKEEEDLLAKEFGDEWKEYVRKVPYKLVPYVY
ncbi:hypothetical protein CC1G_12896 [Coprinopsis cinerea okayama7|uniref:Protein-S-isoprenylcysteine O-methyltransferase n=1 Tax=Coprinopsis cinerea (strain Okayama-7 / 130 / ATCC MYA-4618 / FGSC 9003) TaxID=240176 RepID=A8NAR9_COPC7|nr:hypothetical protein CC1G_12896 [Coprinopsis cinerea okayama7\|eukprot:XP_001831921.1 hypothetical protein CC1G_12896 [Coprinopsis cinerea okayama7\